MNNHNRILAGFAAVLLLIPLLIFPADAAEPADLRRMCSIKLTYTVDDDPIPDAEFRIFRVGDLAEDRSVSLTDVYEEAGVSVGTQTGEGELRKAASALARFVSEQGISCDRTVRTDANGTFIADDLSAGFYLIQGIPAAAEGKTYYTDPQLVFLPFRAVDDTCWMYDAELLPKGEPGDGEPVSITVHKQWDDEGYESLRPRSVTVHLLRGGELYDHVELSEQNGWSHTWTQLLPIGTWSVEEVVPDNYFVTIKNEGDGIVLVNSRKNIDQTGVLWWPVPVLLVAGAAAAGCGFYMRRNGKNEEESDQ